MRGTPFFEVRPNAGCAEPRCDREKIIREALNSIALSDDSSATTTITVITAAAPGTAPACSTATNGPVARSSDVHGRIVTITSTEPM